MQPAATPFNPPPAGLNQLQDLFVRFINLSVGFAFLAVTIVIVVASIKFLTSGGDKGAIAKAQQSITWALLGILFLVIAWLILRLIEAFTGVTLTTFEFKFPNPPAKP